MRLSHASSIIAAITVPALAAGCSTAGADATPKRSAPASSAAAIPVAPPSPTPTATPVPLGQELVSDDQTATMTAYAYRQPTATRAPRPQQDGFVWGSLDVKVCNRPDASGRAVSEGQGYSNFSVSRHPWALVYADSTRASASSIAYNQFLAPEYPFGDTVVPAGRCVRGWITFPVPPDRRPVMVEYLPESARTPANWVIPA